LKKLHAFVLSNGEELVQIEEEGHKNIILVEKVMRGALGITEGTECLMAGSTAERVCLQIIPFVKEDGNRLYELLHAIFSDFDCMISCTENKASFVMDNEAYFICSESSKLNPGFVHLLTNHGRDFVCAENLRKRLLSVTKVIKVKNL